MTQDKYLQLRDSIRAYHGHEKVAKVCNALKTAAITHSLYFSMGECMDEFACSYSTAFRSLQAIEYDPAYCIERRIVEGMGMPRHFISLKQQPIRS